MTSGTKWQEFSRSGFVIAHRLNQQETWRTSSGDEMTGRAGDWKLHEPGRPEDCWTIVDSEFRRTYRLIREDTYERTGVVEARPAEVEESVQTEEGAVIARPGDWIVRRDTGFQWVIPGHKFTVNYKPTN